MASVNETLGVKHLAEEAKQEEEKPEKAKSEEEDREKENLEEESEGSQAAKSEEDDDDDDDGKGAEEKVKKEGAQKIQSSPVTPSASLRPTRERKTVDRFYATSTARASATKPLSIQKVHLFAFLLLYFSLGQKF